MNKKMVSRAEAKTLGRIKCRSAEPCPMCGRYIRYTANDRCTYCASHASTLFLLHKIHHAPWPAEDMPSYIADDKKRLEDANPQDLYNLSRYAKGVWIRAEPCNRKGHLGVRTSQNACWLCTNERSPRQVAQTNGETWYTPTVECPHCHTTAPRRVNNGECQGCKPPRHQTDSQALMNNNPDTVISRDDARLLGLKVYRTGDYCRKGHAGFRYTTTGACVDCQP